jgi:hypothetical protein
MRWVASKKKANHSAAEEEASVVDVEVAVEVVMQVAAVLASLAEKKVTFQGIVPRRLAETEEDAAASAAVRNRELVMNAEWKDITPVTALRNKKVETVTEVDVASADKDLELAMNAEWKVITLVTALRNQAAAVVAVDSEEA